MPAKDSEAFFKAHISCTDQERLQTFYQTVGQGTFFIELHIFRHCLEQFYKIYNMGKILVITLFSQLKSNLIEISIRRFCGFFYRQQIPPGFLQDSTGFQHHVLVRLAMPDVPPH